MKRLTDIAAATALLLTASPLMAVAALAIAATSGRPILFQQQRPGRGGKPFRLVKFRTMRAGTAGDDVRLTRVGRLLRASSIDELPQLYNVIRGEMSLVGPRPLLMEYLPLYTREQARRHDVLPGITGWAQVNGRNALTHEQRFTNDLWYVDNWSLRLDLMIIARTLVSVISRRGVNATGHVTMPKFTGSRPDAERSMSANGRGDGKRVPLRDPSS